MSSLVGTGTSSVAVVFSVDCTTGMLCEDMEVVMIGAGGSLGCTKAVSDMSMDVFILLSAFRVDTGVTD